MTRPPLDPVAEAAARLEVARRDLQQAVDGARAEGASWADVGRTLGISRQAAFKRFGRPRDPRNGAPMTTRSLDHVPDLTEEVFLRIAAGDYAAVRRRMPDEVAAQLTEEAVMGTWTRVVGSVGELEGFSGTTVDLGDGSTDHESFGVVVGDTTLRHEAGELRGRVALDEHDRVVGLLVVPLGTTDLPF